MLKLKEMKNMNKFLTVGVATCIGMAALSAAHAQVCPSAEVFQSILSPVGVSTEAQIGHWAVAVLDAQPTDKPVSIPANASVGAKWTTVPLLGGSFSLSQQHVSSVVSPSGSETKWLMCDYTQTIGGESFTYRVTTAMRM
jgi:hypothetical protein